MKIIYFLVLFTSIYFSSNAQKQRSFLSIGPSVGVPISFNNTKLGSGMGLRGYLGISRQSSLMANLNTIVFPLKVLGNNAFFSSMVGFKTVINNSNFFLYGDAGILFKSGLSKFELMGHQGIYAATGGGIGYSLSISEKRHFDIVPSYNRAFRKFKDYSWIDLHIAYRFALN